MLRLLARLTLVGSAAGLALSLVVIATSLLPPGADSPALKLCLIAGLFVVGFPAIFVISSAWHDYPQRVYLKHMYAGCPAWMRRLTYALLGVGAALFFSSIVLDPGGPGESPLGPGSSLFLGGFGLMAYSAFLAQVYSALHLDHAFPGRRCPNGHVVSPTARFCEQCGQAVPTAAPGHDFQEE